MIFYAMGLTLTFCSLLFATSLITGKIEDNYIGCYYDDVKDQSLPKRTTVQNSTALTIEWCIGQCLLQNATYAGLENSKACLCLDDFGVSLPDTFCSSICPGNRAEYCGGSNEQRAVYSLYAVCEIGYYGHVCDQVCHCKKQAPCNRMTGQCPNECEEKWFGTTCSDTLLSEKYIGCFRDNETRAISPEHFCDNRMSVEFCSSDCTLRNNSIAGLQARCHCFCGETYARYGQLNESRCRDHCSGNPRQKCGGFFANSVYSACPAGFYGPKCHKQCHCYNNSRCVYLTGECNSTCKDGWTGNNCNIRDCKTENGDCSQNETCATVNLNFATIIGCRCLPGFERKAFQEICRDIDECQLDSSRPTSSPCDTFSEYCVNSIGSYDCRCKEGFTRSCGKYDESSCSPTTGVLLGTFLAISLLIIALLIVCLIKSAKSRNTESGKGMAQSDFQRSRKNVSGQHVLEQHEENYDDTPELFGENNAYEKINLEKRQVVLSPTSEYAALKLNDYLNVPSSI